MVSEIAQINHQRRNAATRAGPRRPIYSSVVMIVVLLAAGSAVTACTQGKGQPQASAAVHSAATPGHAAAAPAEAARSAAWAARPGYTALSAATEEAYHYALNHAQLLKWIPCYCGCGPIGHGNNLDCYFEPRADGAIVFEEHASYCRICVDITLRAQQLAGRGASLISIRNAIDAEFGANGYGTETPFPI
jgi:hypothetical protein